MLSHGENVPTRLPAPISLQSSSRRPMIFLSKPHATKTTSLIIFDLRGIPGCFFFDFLSFHCLDSNHRPLVTQTTAFLSQQLGTSACCRPRTWARWRTRRSHVSSPPSPAWRWRRLRRRASASSGRRCERRSCRRYCDVSSWRRRCDAVQDLRVGFSEWRWK